jgi:hypothetical protein
MGAPQPRFASMKAGSAERPRLRNDDGGWYDSQMGVRRSAHTHALVLWSIQTLIDLLTITAVETTTMT